MNTASPPVANSVGGEPGSASQQQHQQPISNVDGVTARILVDLNKYNFLIRQQHQQQQQADVDEDGEDDEGDYYEDDDGDDVNDNARHGYSYGSKMSHHQPNTPHSAAIQHREDLMNAYQNDLSNSILQQQQAASSASSPMMNNGGGGGSVTTGGTDDINKPKKKKAASTPTMNAVAKRGAGRGGGGGRGSRGGGRGRGGGAVKKGPAKVVKMGGRWFSLGSL
jgi:hypothetical protein